MTLIQCKKIEELTRSGYKTIRNSKSENAEGVFDGPVWMKHPSGDLVIVNPDGTLTVIPQVH